MGSGVAVCCLLLLLFGCCNADRKAKAGRRLAANAGLFLQNWNTAQL
jgi:hypothetical protein